ncbi:DUF2637 domain-containing protein [Streptomyces sp. SM12]|uniref:DUF2637 domain-containing protein n=1 Tax=Streptomyces sp. SM12 TaxID=1071602 RepID=UPI0021564EBB|nr:DUF2637 domain-containing protein [Streptomyces sp. SM12]
MAPAVKLTRTHRILIGFILAGAVVIAAIGFVGSYAAVRDLAEEKGFGDFSPFFPIGIDAGIVVLLALDLLLTWLRIPFPLLRQTAWLLTAATVAFNGAAAWGDPLSVGMHAIIPILFIITVEAARHAVGRITDIAADKHMEGVRLWRWILAPFPTFRLWRRMKLWELRSYQEVIDLERDRLVYRARLRAMYGRAWRRRAPVEARLPLKLAHLGVPLDPDATGAEHPTVPGGAEHRASSSAAAPPEEEAVPKSDFCLTRLPQERRGAARARIDGNGSAALSKPERSRTADDNVHAAAGVGGRPRHEPGGAAGEASFASSNPPQRLPEPHSSGPGPSQQGAAATEVAHATRVSTSVAHGVATSGTPAAYATPEVSRTASGSGVALAPDVDYWPGFEGSHPDGSAKPVAGVAHGAAGVPAQEPHAVPEVPLTAGSATVAAVAPGRGTQVNMRVAEPGVPARGAGPEDGAGREAMDSTDQARRQKEEGPEEERVPSALDGGAGPEAEAGPKDEAGRGARDGKEEVRRRYEELSEGDQARSARALAPSLALATGLSTGTVRNYIGDLRKELRDRAGATP